MNKQELFTLAVRMTPGSRNEHINHPQVEVEHLARNILVHYNAILAAWEKAPERGPVAF